MSPNISGFGVDAKDALETHVKRIQRRSMALDQKIIIPQPFGKMLRVRGGLGWC